MTVSSVLEVPAALRLSVSLAIWISLSLAADGQSTKPAPPEDTSFLPRWSKGESRVYEQLKGRRVVSKDGTTNQAGSRARLDLKVVDAGPKGYLLRWTISESALDGERSPKQQPEFENLLKAMEGWNVLLDIDESGNFKGVKNWKEIRSKIEAVNESLLKDRTYQSLPPDSQKRFRAQLKARSQSKEQIEELCAREAKAFLAPIGLTFKGGEPIEYQTRLPNPRGGEPFPTRARFEISRIDPTTARAIIVWRQVVNPASLGTGLGETVGRLGKSLGRPPSPSDSNPYKSLSISDQCQYLMDMQGGWVNDMKQVRTIRNQDGSSVEESLRIRRVDHQPNKSGSESPKLKTAPSSKTG